MLGNVEDRTARRLSYINDRDGDCVSKTREYNGKIGIIDLIIMYKIAHKYFYNLGITSVTKLHSNIKNSKFKILFYLALPSYEEFRTGSYSWLLQPLLLLLLLPSQQLLKCLLCARLSFPRTISFNN